MTVQAVDERRLGQHIWIERTVERQELQFTQDGDVKRVREVAGRREYIREHHARRIDGLHLTEVVVRAGGAWRQSNR